MNHPTSTFFLLLKTPVSIVIYLRYVYVFSCMCACVPCAIPGEDKASGPSNWSYGQLWTTVWVPEIESSLFERARIILNCRVISQSPVIIPSNVVSILPPFYNWKSRSHWSHMIHCIAHSCEVSYLLWPLFFSLFALFFESNNIIRLLFTD